MNTVYRVSVNNSSVALDLEADCADQAIDLAQGSCRPFLNPYIAKEMHFTAEQLDVDKNNNEYPVRVYYKIIHA